jgi:hypothetical protein
MAEPAQTVKMAGFGYTTDLLNRTVNLASTIVRADEGKALTLDTSAPNKFKLAGDGDLIFGRLEVFEDRANEGTKVGNAKLHLMGVKLPIKSGSTVNVGDYVVGAGDGEVKAEVATDETVRPSNLYVVEVANGFATVYSRN